MLSVDANYNIYLTRGDTGIFTLDLVDDETKEPFTPGSGDKIRFAMSKKYGSTREETLILKDISINDLLIKIDPEDTKNLDFGKYKYDVEYTDASGHVSTVLLADFNVTKEVY